jgi:hypothetical protein
MPMQLNDCLRLCMIGVVATLLDEEDLLCGMDCSHAHFAQQRSQDCLCRLK